MNISFREFILNENKAYLGERLGTLLTALQELQQNSDGMGTRQVVANSERLVNQIRRILHGNWSRREEKYLKHLQIIGVALAKAIDEKDNLMDVIPSVTSELENLLSKMQVPVHSLGSEEQPEEEDSEGVAPPEEMDPQPKQQPQAPQDQQQAPPQEQPPQEQPMPQQPMPMPPAGTV